ncbi:MAG: efflux RND transporter periplasmic adaptor subunit [Gammaproteobacteria bacterium]|nr:efflux RND transporter periplasmic adaptor subunit [Gammaproteobacteria bacterium]MCB1863242.1 efflux RND transporter periplasmic adaptor subunit [Gammaproteobacteria bacterium]
MKTAAFVVMLLGLAGTNASAQQSVATETAVYQVVPREYRLDGVVEAVSHSTVSAQTQGQVAEILVDVDDYVEKGAILLLLKDNEQQAGVKRAEAEIMAAAARLQESIAEHQRINELHRQQLASKAELDRAVAELEAARARREAGEAVLDQAREQLEYTRVRAPYSGIVTDRFIEVGEMANPGKPLIRGLSLDRLRVIVDVPQSLIPAVRKRAEARIQLAESHAVAAEKITISPYADGASSTFEVRLTLPEGIGDLFPGMFVKVSFVTGEQRHLLIPAKAVVYRSEVSSVYVVDPAGGVSLRQIRPGRRLHDRIAVLAGLENGEAVALDPVAAAYLLNKQLAESRDE